MNAHPAEMARTYMKCRSGFRWLIVVNILTSWVPFLLLATGFISDKIPAASFLVFVVVVTLGMAAAFAFFLFKLIKCSGSYWLCLCIPIALIPLLAIIAYVFADQKSTAELLGQNPEQVPSAPEVRLCPCGGHMVAVSSRQRLKAMSKRPSGFELTYRCRACEKEMAIESLTPMIKRGISTSLLLPLGICGIPALMAPSPFSTDKLGGIILVLGVIGYGSYSLWRLAQTIRNRIRYPIVELGAS